MILSLMMASLLFDGQASQPVPGLCAAPAADNVGKAGCYLSAQLPIEAGQGPVWWHIAEFTDRPAAQAEAARHQHATVVTAHGRHWLYVIGEQAEAVQTGTRHAAIGPLWRPTSGPVTVRFLESIFPPGMQTRAHAHPGPEAFYVVEGEQCMDSPSGQARIGVGESYILESGPHLQAAPTGRRNLVALILPAEESWMSLTPDWIPTSYCDR